MTRSSRVGFDWPNIAGAWAKLREELGELEVAVESGTKGDIAAELGDLLFATVDLARKLGVDAEDALHAATRRFTGRFDHVQRGLAARGRTIHDSTIEEMEELWREAKELSRT